VEIRGHDCSYTHGRIMSQSEGAEIFFRRIELQPLEQIGSPVR
jgi:hypothetical protein